MPKQVVNVYLEDEIIEQMDRLIKMDRYKYRTEIIRKAVDKLLIDEFTK